MRTKTIKRSLFTLIILIGIFFLGILPTNFFAQKVILPQIGKALGVPVTAASAHFSLMSGIQAVELALSEGTETALTIKKVEIQISLRALLKKTILLSSIKLDDAKVALKSSPKTFEVAGLEINTEQTEQSDAKDAKTESWQTQLGKLAINGVDLHYLDSHQSVRGTIKEIAFEQDPNRHGQINGMLSFQQGENSISSPLTISLKGSGEAISISLIAHKLEGVFNQLVFSGQPARISTDLILGAEKTEFRNTDIVLGLVADPAVTINASGWIKSSQSQYLAEFKSYPALSEIVTLLPRSLLAGKITYDKNQRHATPNLTLDILQSEALTAPVRLLISGTTGPNGYQLKEGSVQTNQRTILQLTGDMQKTEAVIAVPIFDLDALMALPATSANAKPAADAPTDQPFFPASLPYSGKISLEITKLIFGERSLDNISATVGLSTDAISIDDLKANYRDRGTFTANLRLTPETLAGTLQGKQLSLEGLDKRNGVAFDGTMNNLKVVFSGESGSLSDFKKSLSATVRSDYSELRLPSRFQDTPPFNIIFLPFKVVSGLGGMASSVLLPAALHEIIGSISASLGESGRLYLRKAIINFDIKNGSVIIPESEINTNLLPTVEFKGTINFDNSVSMVARLKLLEVRVPLPIGGTLQRPLPSVTRFIPSLIEALGLSVAGAAKRFIPGIGNQNSEETHEEIGVDQASDQSTIVIPPTP